MILFCRQVSTAVLMGMGAPIKTKVTVQNPCCLCGVLSGRDSMKTFLGFPISYGKTIPNTRFLHFYTLCNFMQLMYQVAKTVIQSCGEDCLSRDFLRLLKSVHLCKEAIILGGQETLTHAKIAISTSVF